MGMPLFEEGSIAYCCKECNTILAIKKCLISTNYQGSTGVAYLFESVSNVIYKEKTEKMFLSGKHIVGDVVCTGCNKVVGWKYYYASEKEQQHKVNKVILEKSYLIESQI